MAKNMYQKREERKAKAQEDNTITKEVQSKVINWLMETYENTHSNPYKISTFQN